MKKGEEAPGTKHQDTSKKVTVEVHSSDGRSSAVMSSVEASPGHKATEVISFAKALRKVLERSNASYVRADRDREKQARLRCIYTVIQVWGKKRACT